MHDVDISMDNGYELSKVKQYWGFSTALIMIKRSLVVILLTDCWVLIKMSELKQV